ncbi:MAG TPA: pyridoxal phosphate-dependent aminotransferase [Candidatus Eisenbacteria bacterium]|nr:pyridoxal phosphate-dependent aminotransferase [Candidatus Eisenbacteria bacterium]
MLSRRLPHDATPNAWSRLLAERRGSGATLLDLTEANPTRVGLGGAGEDTLAALADPAAVRYEPDPRGARAAREAVAGYYADRGIRVDADDLVLTAGTSESYAHLFRLLADPGDAILAPAPSYPLLEPIAALEGVALRPYRIAWDGCWHVDLGSVAEALAPGARAMVLVQPNHPTGSCLDARELAEVEALCERHGVALIADEVFGDFPWRDQRVGPGLPSLLGARRVPTFVLSGLSKVCGMPQLKLGWIAVAGPDGARAEARHGLEWIADLFLTVGTPVQAALPRLLAGRQAWQARMRERIAVNRARLGDVVAQSPALERRDGVGGWVAVLKLPGGRDEEAWVLELLRRDVVVHPGAFYDFEDEPYLVLSLIVAPGVFATGLERIAALASD